VRLPDIPNVNVKNADLRTQLEEASFLLQHPVQPSKG
jgi:hypothetical protein